MPKMKNNSGMSKRVKVTGGGKLMRERSGHQAGAAFASTPVRSSRKRRRLANTVDVSRADVKRVRKMLGR